MLPYASLNSVSIQDETNVIRLFITPSNFDHNGRKSAASAVVAGAGTAATFKTSEARARSFRPVQVAS